MPIFILNHTNLSFKTSNFIAFYIKPCGENH